LDAAEAACEFLAQTPEAGTLCQFRDPEAAGIRVWSIRGFQNFLIFYRPVPEGADIVRVLHGAQDIESLFSE
ncbi:MAG: type II toxin-antitoxin system RelE/ParE family toxin, partial [Rhodopirellula sp.]|nr:type II toxin-antitoxin system RelE/ParE family toxin [Rhodopirellula sp.]